MGIQDTVAKLGSTIINLINVKIKKELTNYDNELEKTLEELKTKIDEAGDKTGSSGTVISLTDFVNNTKIDTLNTENKTIVGAINEKANATDVESKANSADLENYLPLSGGTVIGQTTFNDKIVLHNTFIELDSDTEYSDWGYNWQDGTGAGFSIRSAGYHTGESKYKGAFLLWARKNTTSQYVLAGRCDGVLEWCGKEVLHTGNAYNKTQIDNKIGDIETALDAIIAG